MTRVKIVSNPYKKKVDYYCCEGIMDSWVNIREQEPNSELREIDSANFFFPFKMGLLYPRSIKYRPKST